MLNSSSSPVSESPGYLADELFATKRTRLRRRSTRKAWHPGPCGIGYCQCGATHDLGVTVRVGDRNRARTKKNKCRQRCFVTPRRATAPHTKRQRSFPPQSTPATETRLDPTLERERRARDARETTSSGPRAFFRSTGLSGRAQSRPLSRARLSLFLSGRTRDSIQLSKESRERRQARTAAVRVFPGRA